MVESLDANDLHSSVPPLNMSCRLVSVSARGVLIKTMVSCFILLTVMLNLLVIISISHFRHSLFPEMSNSLYVFVDGSFVYYLLLYTRMTDFRQLQTPTNIILLSLAVSDFLVGLTVMPIAIVLLESCTFLRKFTCALSYPLGFILTSSSIANMVLISVDRYVAICDPLRYSSVITHNRIKFSVSLCWIWSVVYNTILLKDHFLVIDWSNPCCPECVVVLKFISGIIDLVITFIGPVTVIIALYMRVFVVALSQARAMRSKISAVRSNSVMVKKSELRAARTLGIILIVFIICLFPFYIPSMMGQNITGDVKSLASILLFVCNSTFNPLIYAFFYPWFRKAVKLIVSLQILQQGSRVAKIM